MKLNFLWEAEKKKKSKKDKMPCDEPQKAPSGSSKKFKVKACKKGEEKLLGFGDPNMQHYKQGKDKSKGHGDEKRRDDFHSRHNCDSDPKAKDKFQPKYWSCNWSW